VFQSERSFQFWDYNVSFRQLLLRSPSHSDCASNVDIVFWGVSKIQLPTLLNRPVISVRRGVEPAADGKLLFSIEADNESGIIVAEGCKVLENALDLFDSSLVYAHRDRAESEYGVVLARFRAS
jgi:hypothetical protein